MRHARHSTPAPDADGAGSRKARIAGRRGALSRRDLAIPDAVAPCDPVQMLASLALTMSDDSPRRARTIAVLKRHSDLDPNAPDIDAVAFWPGVLLSWITVTEVTAPGGKRHLHPPTAR